MTRVRLPPHLRTLAQVKGEVQLDVPGRVTRGAVLDALEARYPMLRGTIRDHVTEQRRPFLRFFACERDLTRSEEHTSELQSLAYLVCRLLLEKKKSTLTTSSISSSISVCTLCSYTH